MSPVRPELVEACPEPVEGGGEIFSCFDGLSTNGDAGVALDCLSRGKGADRDPFTFSFFDEMNEFGADTLTPPRCIITLELSNRCTVRNAIIRGVTYEKE